MSVLSTLRHSLTKLVTTRVTWHPDGITAVRRFTIEPCAALPSRRLKGPPSSPIKNANPEEATPFTMIPGLIPKEPMSHPHNKAYIRVQAWLQQTDEETPPEPEHEPWTLVQGEIPEEPLCHTHNMAYIRMKAWLQQLEGGVEINHFYMNSELPLSFMKDDIEELYD